MPPRYYAGNPDPELIDPDIVDALSILDENYFVFFEVNWGERSSDIAIIRAGEPPTQHSTLIVAEVKHFDKAVRGTVNGQWSVEIAPNKWAPLPGFHYGEDTSPYWQTVNTANTVNMWLFNNQRLYRDKSNLVDAIDAYKVWPDLVLISPDNVWHRLPRKPDSGYGMWFYNLDSWIDHVLSWEPKLGTLFSVGELEALAESLNLQELVFNHLPEDHQASSVEQFSDETGAALLERLTQLEHQVGSISRDVKSIKALLTSAGD